MVLGVGVRCGLRYVPRTVGVSTCGAREWLRFPAPRPRTVGQGKGTSLGEAAALSLGSKPGL